jgi:hypothetical protein
VEQLHSAVSSTVTSVEIVASHGLTVTLDILVKDMEVCYSGKIQTVHM